MPMLDAYIPQGALRPEAEQQLLAQLTDALIINEGADPTNPQVRSIAWLFVHRPFEVWPILGAIQLERVYVLITLVCWFFYPKKV